MKTFSKTLLGLFVIMAFAFTACKKDYTCDCESTDQNGDVISSTSNTAEFSSKSDAEDWCSGQESEVSSGGNTVTTTCELE